MRISDWSSDVCSSDLPPGTTASHAIVRFACTAARSCSAPKPHCRPATIPCDVPPRRPKKPCGIVPSTVLRVISTKAARHLFESIARKLARSDAFQLAAHQRRTPFLDPPPAPQRRHEPRRGLRVERGMRENDVAIGSAALRERGWAYGENAGF